MFFLVTVVIVEFVMEWTTNVGLILFVTMGSAMAGVVTPECIGNPLPSEPYTHSQVLSPDKYILYWKHDGVQVVFIVFFKWQSLF